MKKRGNKWHPFEDIRDGGASDCGLPENQLVADHASQRRKHAYTVALTQSEYLPSATGLNHCDL